MIYTVDLDLFKIVTAHATRVQWRVSSSGLGLHLRWTCPHKGPCCICQRFQAALDDPRRRELDATRKPRRRGVLYTTKGNKKAGPWRTVTDFGYLSAIDPPRRRG